MDTIKVTTNRDGRDCCHHREAPKLLQNKPLEHDKEGCGNQLQSHKRPCQQARQERREGVVHHKDTHPPMTTTIVVEASIVATQATNSNRRQEAL
jgi:hypothetical protein